ncbi:MAG: DUF2270 domain-containing protein [candidate division KSB1 bacterium]|nr:DUF2270 domain-containing protein [candidate division KSB1 bacterium]MDZ7367588.1 DUF2270 domain-containing protein [candidate division KSB1 bacterium]MDZ7405380.1 DUF2270 domain-containing protein [candidate division KSB1 bacterium]
MMTTPESPHQNQNNEKPRENHQPVWTFRGYEMRPSEFNTAMVHYYRAEIQRSNVWRQRLDTTTNWAVIASSAAISFALSAPGHHYGVLILNTLLVTLFLWMEARRYRYYELWAYRTRLMETDFFAAMLAPPFAPRPEWAESMVETLHTPVFPISMWEAFGRRFRRNFVWIFLVLGLSLLLKVFMHPTMTTSWENAIERLQLGPIDGWTILMAGLVYNGLLFLIGFATAGLRQATGEVLPKSSNVPVLEKLWHAMEVKDASTGGSNGKGARKPRGRKRQQLLCMIISARPKNIAERIMRDLRRGVTGLHGAGMHSQQERDVLIVAATVSEIAGIKTAVKAEDPNAFVIVMPAQEVMGRGFQALEI